MRERITYIIREPTSEFSPDQLHVDAKSFAVEGLNAIKEDHLTFSYNQIPPPLWRILRNCHEFHIRWSSTQPYPNLSPYISRITPGLHVSFTPLQGRSGKRICDFLKSAFGQSMKCDKTETAFTTPSILSERFATSASKQYYTFVHNLQLLAFFIQKEICGQTEKSIPCQLRAHDVTKADLFDLDYDAVSQSLVVKAMWTNPNGDDGKWYETLHKGPQTEDTLEVGVLMPEVPLEDEELRFSGFLTRVGQDSKPSPTLFSTPARHHPLKDFKYSTTFSSGLHPTMTLSFPFLPEPPSPYCALHAHLTMASTLFLDPYAFTDLLFLQSHHLKKLHSISGATDLEAPEWTVSTWGSTALFELDVPGKRAKFFNATIPMHLRYLPPSNFSTILLPAPWPVVFYACPAEKGSKFATSPFDRTNLGYDGLFGINTVFYHAEGTAPDRLVETLEVPVLDLTKSNMVEAGTTLTILLGTVWVLWIIVRGLARNWQGTVGPKKDPKKRQ